MSQPDFVDALKVEAASLRARLTVIEGVIALYAPANGAPPPEAAVVEILKQLPGGSTEMPPNVIAKRYHNKIWAIRRQAQLEEAGIRSSITFTGGAWEVRPVA